MHAFRFLRDCVRDIDVVHKIDILSLEGQQENKDNIKMNIDVEWDKLEAKFKKDKMELLEKHRKSMADEERILGNTKIDNNSAESTPKIQDRNERILRQEIPIAGTSRQIFHARDNPDKDNILIMKPKVTYSPTVGYNGTDHVFVSEEEYKDRIEVGIERDCIDSRNYGRKVELPKLELAGFSGDVTEYWCFIRQFELYLESKTRDPVESLSYLYNYCCGRARKAISQCLTLEPNRGYATARAILRRLYGQPHKVAMTQID